MGGEGARGKAVIKRHRDGVSEHARAVATGSLCGTSECAEVQCTVHLEVAFARVKQRHACVSIRPSTVTQGKTLHAPFPQRRAF